MRSSFFVILSVFVHALCVAAIAVSPSRVSQPEGKEIQVQIGEASETPGLENAPEGISQAAAPVAEEKPVQVAKAAVRKTRVVKAPMEKVTALPPKEPVMAEVKDEKLDPEIDPPAAATPVAEAEAQPEFTPVKESAPAGIESDESTEAGTQEPQSADEPVTATGQGDQHSENAELAHGGATQAGAVSYLDLKQAPGNKSPAYPMQARREARQGYVELVYRVTKEGKVSDLQIAKSSGHKDLDQEAARAVAQFKFVPGQEGWARHPVAFTLKGTAAQAPSKLRSAKTE